ncbi:MAG: ATP-binding protein [Chloroflexi bacterium]|nr:ATP-binding protein [Chloroflexota bacterium]
MGDTAPAEGRDLDFKLQFDPTNPAALLELVKDIVAFANSGGGTIVLGRNETHVPGLPVSAVTDLDSSRIGDAVDRHTEKGMMHISHAREDLANGNVVVTISVEPSLYPVVIGRDGTVDVPGKGQTSILRRGDIWVRHGSRTERLSQADIRSWVDGAYERGLDRLLSAAQVVRDAGLSRTIELRMPQGEVLRTPSDLLDDALRRNALGLPHLLTGRELLWAFTQRRFFSPTDEQLELLVESALRRPVTLHWWLLDQRVSDGMVKRLLDRLLVAEDRDKSDAASSAVELASLFLDDEGMKAIIGGLRSSRYSHFRNAASRVRGPRRAELGLRKRARRKAPDGRQYDELNAFELERLADEIAAKELQAPSQAGVRNLADVLIALWLKGSGQAKPPGE